MKKLNKMRQAAGALTALAALIALTPSASAIVLTYEEAGNGHNIGDAFTGGSFQIKILDFDMGTVYPNLASGTSVGSTTPAVGIPLVNAIPGQVQAVNAMPAAGGGLEDTWGIARITDIFDSAGVKIWSEAGKNAQLTIMFYGEQDFFVHQNADSTTSIDGVGLHADLYFQSKADGSYTPYDGTLGGGGRTGVDTYTNVTDGTKILTTISTAGFIHDVGDPNTGGAATEFNSLFNPNSGGTGQTYLSVTGGTDAAQFNTNGFLAPFAAGTTADLKANFTTVALGVGGVDPVSNWLVSSNDPIRGNVSGVPDAGSSVLMFSLGLGFLAVAYRRRRA
jgi:hypothetical protein